MVNPNTKLGIAMGEGTDVAMESAGVTLLRGDLNLIPELFNLSRRTLRIVKQNLFWLYQIFEFYSHYQAERRPLF